VSIAGIAVFAGTGNYKYSLELLLNVSLLIHLTFGILETMNT
jgi:hypothetical protein